MAKANSFAIVKSGAEQVVARPKEVVRVARRPEKQGAKVTLSEVLFVQNEGKASVGQPQVKGAQVKCTVKAHGHGKKMIAFRFKRRKGVRVKRGARHDYTDLVVDEIKVGT